MRDRHTAAAFGRPYRIRDEDCDVEPLTPADLNFDVDSQMPLAIHQVVHEHYVLEMSKLAMIRESTLQCPTFTVFKSNC